MTLRERREERWGNSSNLRALPETDSTEQENIVYMNAKKDNVVPIQPTVIENECVGGVCALNWSPKKKSA